MPTKTASEFDEAMLDVYRRAKAEANYKLVVLPATNKLASRNTSAAFCLDCRVPGPANAATAPRTTSCARA